MKSNLMDVLLLLLKAAVHQQRGTIRLQKSEVLRAEDVDLRMTRGLDGTVVLEVVGGEGADSKIIVPHGSNPLTIIE